MINTKIMPVSMKRGTSLLALGMAASLLGAMPTAVLAQAAPAAAPEEVVIVTGSRRPARSAADAAAPVDIIGGAEIAAQGDTDVANLIRNVVPSFNVNAQSINDAASIVRPANLRGLAPDHTLVLLNGKRRHRASVIAFIGGGISDGAQGPDISIFPTLGLKQVEVLRDGAAAQYGSDAIAGVMNFRLREDTDSFEVEAKYGQYYEGDGTTYQVAGNFGVALTDAGFANLTVEYRQSGETSRSVQRGDAAALRAAGNTNISADPVQTWGVPEVKSDFKVFLNAGIDAGEGREFYAFGNYGKKETDGGFYFRNPNTRGGVFSNTGGDTWLVGDLTPGTTPCASVVPSAAGLAALKADPNCFGFAEILPGGFTPRFGGELVDLAGYLGMKGKLGKVNYDVSFGAGLSDIDFNIRNTINPSLGPNTPTSFRPGGQIQLEKTFNLDLSYEVAVASFASPLNIAGGFEWRNESFELKAGDQASWERGPLADQGFGLGSNGFQGFNPSTAGVWDRSNMAVYVDLEADVTKALTLGAAVRSEDFDDFGTTTNFKLSGLLRASDALTLRSTYSTGFRAPTPGQSNIINTTTSLVSSNGVQSLQNTGTIPPTSVLGKLLGGKPLQPETSKNFSIGAGLNLGGFKATLDFFNIDMEDRIRLSAPTKSLDREQFLALSAAEQASIKALGGDTPDFTAFKFFVNGVDTTTRGVDFVASYPLNLFGGKTSLSFAANWTETEVTRGQKLVGIEADGNAGLRQVEEGLPKLRGNLGLTHSVGKFSMNGRINYFGEYYEAHADAFDLPINADSQVTLDAEVSYSLTDAISVTIGAENLLDSYPTENPWAEVLGAKYSVTAPGGFNGGFYYLKLSYKR
jgi:iron complex outermembrane recepter protein